MDCFVASAPLRKRFAFVAGKDGFDLKPTTNTAVVPALSRDPSVSAIALIAAPRR